MIGAVEARFGERCHIGIGLNSGLVLAGTLGGGELVEFGVIGDPVNVAARVQDATRDLGEALLLTEATRCLLEDSSTQLEARGALTLRGKRHPIPVYAPVTDDLRNVSRTPVT